VATRITTVAKSASTSISPPARVAGRQKYRKTIAPMEVMSAVCDILAEIHNITAAIAAKANTRSHLFGRSEKTKTMQIGAYNYIANQEYYIARGYRRQSRELPAFIEIMYCIRQHYPPGTQENYKSFS